MMMLIVLLAALGQTTACQSNAQCEGQCSICAKDLGSTESEGQCMLCSEVAEDLHFPEVYTGAGKFCDTRYNNCNPCVESICSDEHREEARQTRRVLEEDTDNDSDDDDGIPHEHKPFWFFLSIGMLVCTCAALGCAQTEDAEGALWGFCMGWAAWMYKLWHYGYGIVDVIIVISGLSMCCGAASSEIRGEANTEGNQNLNVNSNANSNSTVVNVQGGDSNNELQMAMMMNMMQQQQQLNQQVQPQVQPQEATNPVASDAPPIPAVAVDAADSKAQPTTANADDGASLTELLAELKLTQFEAALGELGAAFVSDLADLEEQDLIEIGMKKLEVKRLLRNVAETPS